MLEKEENYFQAKQDLERAKYPHHTSISRGFGARCPICSPPLFSSFFSYISSGKYYNAIFFLSRGKKGFQVHLVLMARPRKSNTGLHCLVIETSKMILMARTTHREVDAFRDKPIGLLSNISLLYIVITTKMGFITLGNECLTSYQSH
jgi:hypothetical protein